MCTVCAVLFRFICCRAEAATVYKSWHINNNNKTFALAENCVQIDDFIGTPQNAHHHHHLDVTPHMPARRAKILILWLYRIVDVSAFVWIQ